MSTQEELDTYNEGVLRRYRNLKMFRGKTDEQIIEYLNNRPPKPEDLEEPETASADEDEEAYKRRFKSKMKVLQTEYGVDMNDANDADSLKALVRYMLQLEVIDSKIRAFYTSESTNTKALKDLGDFQANLQRSISDLQEKLGITRRARKEKHADDLPKYIEQLQSNALDLWKRATTPVICGNDQIELARLWFNFPKLDNEASLKLECWKCHERIIFNI